MIDMSDTAIQASLDAYAAHIKADYKAFGGTQDFVVTFEAGKKYVRVVVSSSGSRSAHSFIDDAGNIWKSASWKTPAKNFIRGNIHTRNFSRIQWTGAR